MAAPLYYTARHTGTHKARVEYARTNVHVRSRFDPKPFTTMASGGERFAVRLRASKALLASFRGTTGFLHLSESECAELLHELEGPAMTTVEVANFMDEIRAMSFGQAEERQLVEALRKKLVPPARSAVVSPLGGHPIATSGQSTAASGHLTDNPKLQNYEALTLYLPASVWESMSKGDPGMCYRFLASLGLVSLSESTARNLSLAILGAQHKVDEILAMARNDKVAFAETTKLAFHRTRVLCPPPRHHFAKLCSTVQEFQYSFPDWFQELYAKELPAMPPWPQETWARLVSNTNCRKERGATSFLRSSGSFAAPSASGPNAMLMQQLQLMQQQIQALGPGFDSRRFRTDTPTGPTSPERLPNGALLTISPRHGEANYPQQNGPAAPRALADAPGGVEAADAAGAAVEAPPAKRPRISVDEVSQRILESASTANAETAGEGGSPTAEAGKSGSPTAGAGKSGSSTAETGGQKKASAKKAGRGVPKSVCPLACKHDGAAKAFKCHWHKLNCKTYTYVSSKDKPRAQKLANEWLTKMGEKRGLTAPAIEW